jgi:3-oxoacyl-[acyl-carrier protein] reductase
MTDSKATTMTKKVILLTGASGGIGKALTAWFKQRDYVLVLHYFNTPIDETESATIFPYEADLRDEKQINALVDEVIKRFGRIDVLINNAGISKSAMAWKTEYEAWKETMSINLDAPFLLSKAVIPAMRAAKSGRIINISSIVAQTGAIGTAAYTASKAGLIGLSKTLSKELAPNAITVNALALGYFNTGIIDDVPEAIQQTIIETIPLKQLGDPQAICATIDWLISDEALYVTGQVIHLNGGLYV